MLFLRIYDFTILRKIAGNSFFPIFFRIIIHAEIANIQKRLSEIKEVPIVDYSKKIERWEKKLGLSEEKCLQTERELAALMTSDSLTDKQKKAIHKELLRVLASHDDFWPRWIVSSQSGVTR